MKYFDALDRIQEYYWTGVAILLSVFIGLIVFEKITTSQCLSYGYPEAKIDFFATRYCVKRENQTDIVVPLREAWK